MRLLYTLLFIFTSTLFTNAQSGANWEWASVSGTSTGSLGQETLDVATDASGNVYATGRFNGTLTLGTATITATLQDAFLVKYDAAGNVLWLKGYNSTYNEMGEIVTLDADGNVYIGGTNSASTTGSSFIAKYDGSGTLLWSKTLSLFEVGGINIGPDGNPIVMESNQNNKYIYKLNKTTGLQMWQVQNNGVGSNAGTTYKDFLDASGNVYYTCFIPGSGTVSVAGQTITATGVYTNSFVASIDNNGATRWVQTFTEVQIAIAYTVDKYGKSYIGKAGGAGSTFQGISTGGNKYYELNNAGVLTGYLAEYPFARKIRVKDDGIYSFTVLNGGVAAYSQTYGSYYYFLAPNQNFGLGVVVKYNLADRSVIWANSFEMNGAAGIPGDFDAIDITTAGKVVVAGRYRAALKFGSIVKSATVAAGTPGYLQPYDLFVAQFDGNNIPAQTMPITTWTGAANNMNFNDAANWSNGVPTGYANAIIPAGVSNYPNNFSATTYMRKLTINAGVTLTLPLATKASLGIENNGTIEITEAGTFYGAFDDGGTTLVSGTGKVVLKNAGTTYFGNGNTLGNSLEFNATGTFVFYGGTITGNLLLTNGVVRASSPLVMSTANATVTNAATSAISGTLSRRIAASGTYKFPVTSLPTPNGNQPVTLTFKNISGPQYVSVSFSSSITGSTPNTTAGGVTVTQLLDGGIWTITPDVPLASGTYTVTLEERGFSNSVPTANRYVVLKRANSSSSWGFFGNNGLATYSSTVITATAGNISGFSDFAIGIANSTVPVVLPVNFLSFTAEKGPGEVSLHWQTAGETNNSYFNVQYSTNTTDWKTVGKVDAKNDFSYSFVHHTPATGANYYRLQQVDKDGKVVYTPVRKVDFGVAKPALLLYPNPVAGNRFTLDFGQSLPGSVGYRIIGVDGRSLQTGILTHQQETIAIERLPKGMYKIALDDGQTISFSKL